MRHVGLALLFASALACASANAQVQTTVAAAPAAGLEPEAREALNRVGAAMRALNGFHVVADVTTELVLDSGQKVQISEKVEYRVRRPNMFRITQTSSRKQREYFYDGKSVTLFAPRLGYYGTIAAPATIAATLDAAAEKYGVEVPLADLFDLGQDPEMIARIQSGFVVGTDMVGGIECDQFAYRQERVDWQLWIRRTGAALPCKIVITTKTDPSMPEYAAVLTWISRTAPPASGLAFTPPADALPIKVAEASE